MRAALTIERSKTEKFTVLTAQKLIELGTLADEELEALGEGRTVAGLVLDELDKMSYSELKTQVRGHKAELAAQKKKYVSELEAAHKQADALQKRNDKLLEQAERYESGSDGGWEFSVRWLEKMSEQAQKIHSAAMTLESMAAQWTQLIEGGDARALAGHPFLLSNLAFYQNLVLAAADHCSGALQQAMAADHPDLEFPAGTQYPVLGFSRNNLPKDMKFEPKSVEDADSGAIDFDAPSETWGGEFEEHSVTLV